MRAVVQHAAGGHSARLHLDVAGYRERPAGGPGAFAQQVADEVRERRREGAGADEPSDRKVVHDTVAELDGVATTSVGEEPRRRVVISPSVTGVAGNARRRLERLRELGYLGPGVAAHLDHAGGTSDRAERLRPSPATVSTSAAAAGSPAWCSPRWPARPHLVEATAPGGDLLRPGWTSSAKRVESSSRRACARGTRREPFELAAAAPSAVTVEIAAGS